MVIIFCSISEGYLKVFLLSFELLYLADNNSVGKFRKAEMRGREFVIEK